MQVQCSTAEKVDQFTSTHLRTLPDTLACTAIHSLLRPTRMKASLRLACHFDLSVCLISFSMATTNIIEQRSASFQKSIMSGRWWLKCHELPHRLRFAVQFGPLNSMQHLCCAQRWHMIQMHTDGILLAGVSSCTQSLQTWQIVFLGSSSGRFTMPMRCT